MHLFHPPFACASLPNRKLYIVESLLCNYDPASSLVMRAVDDDAMLMKNVKRNISLEVLVTIAIRR